MWIIEWKRIVYIKCDMLNDILILLWTNVGLVRCRERENRKKAHMRPSYKVHVDKISFTDK